MVALGMGWWGCGGTGDRVTGTRWLWGQGSGDMAVLVAVAGLWQRCGYGGGGGGVTGPQQHQGWGHCGDIPPAVPSSLTTSRSASLTSWTSTR